MAEFVGDVLGASPLRLSRGAERPAPRTPSGGGTAAAFFLGPLIAAPQTPGLVFFMVLPGVLVWWLVLVVGLAGLCGRFGRSWGSLPCPAAPWFLHIFRRFLSMNSLILSTFGVFLSA